MWFDSHCHLHLLEDLEPLEAIVRGSQESDLDGLVTVGIDLASSERSVAIAERLGVWASVGVHPNEADQWGESSSARLEELASDACVVAIGETGLDFYRKGASPSRQAEVFRAHIDLARRLDKALVIHTRDSVEDALEVIEQMGAPKRFVFHCWSGDEASLRRAIDLGAYLSFAGNLTFASAGDLREAAALVPPDRVLVETDSPFLSPVPFRGKINTPARVGLVGEELARTRGVGREEAERLSTANARALFGLDL